MTFKELLFDYHIWAIEVIDSNQEINITNAIIGLYSNDYITTTIQSPSFTGYMGLIPQTGVILRQLYSNNISNPKTRLFNTVSNLQTAVQILHDNSIFIDGKRYDNGTLISSKTFAIINHKGHAIFSNNMIIDPIGLNLITNSITQESDPDVIL